MDAQTMLTKAEDFIWKYARLIDRQLFAALFRGGSKEMVVSALLAYQNPDGGFGNALEPDKRCPASQPVDVEVALKVLDMIAGFDQTQLIQPACNFLSTISLPGGGVPFALPSVNQYPHAPWWQTPDPAPASLNPTASLTGLLLKHGVTHPWVQEATAFCWREIAESETREFHDLFPMIIFLENAPEPARAARELERIAKRIQDLGLVEMNPLAGGYVHKPLEWAPTPQAYCCRLFTQETIEQNLDWMASSQQEDGGWPINWQPVSPAVEMEWRGWVTIQALRTLKAYHRI